MLFAFYNYLDQNSASTTFEWFQSFPEKNDVGFAMIQPYAAVLESHVWYKDLRETYKFGNIEKQISDNMDALIHIYSEPELFFANPQYHFSIPQRNIRRSFAPQAFTTE